MKGEPETGKGAGKASIAMSRLFPLFPGKSEDVGMQCEFGKIAGPAVTILHIAQKSSDHVFGGGGFLPSGLEFSSADLLITGKFPFQERWPAMASYGQLVSQHLGQHPAGPLVPLLSLGVHKLPHPAVEKKSTMIGCSHQVLIGSLQLPLFRPVCMRWLGPEKGLR